MYAQSTYGDNFIISGVVRAGQFYFIQLMCVRITGVDFCKVLHSII